MPSNKYIIDYIRTEIKGKIRTVWYVQFRDSPIRYKVEPAVGYQQVMKTK